MDFVVDGGQTGSRSSAAARAIDRERRREIVARDAAVLARTGAEADLDGLAEYAARTSLDDLH